MVYEFEWHTVDDPAPPVESEPYIHFTFMLRFPDVPPGKYHVAHFCFNVLQEPGTNETGISIVRRGFLLCVPFSRSDVKEYVEGSVAEAFNGSSRENALARLNTKFINSDVDFSDEFAGDLIEADELLALIDEAFNHVERGDGITLHQAVVNDDYGSEEEFLAAEKIDTEKRWQDVPDSALAANPQFMTFLDPVSFRYYIPAAMSWAINNYDNDEKECCFFTYLAVLPTIAPREIGRGLGEAFDLEGFIRDHSFTPAQINAIYRFICFMAIRVGLEMDEDHYAAVKKWRQSAVDWRFE